VSTRRVKRSYALSRPLFADPLSGTPRPLQQATISQYAAGTNYSVSPSPGRRDVGMTSGRGRVSCMPGPENPPTGTGLPPDCGARARRRRPVLGRHRLRLSKRRGPARPRYVTPATCDLLVRWARPPYSVVRPTTWPSRPSRSSRPPCHGPYVEADGYTAREPCSVPGYLRGREGLLLPRRSRRRARRGQQHRSRVSGVAAYPPEGAAGIYPAGVGPLPCATTPYITGRRVRGTAA